MISHMGAASNQPTWLKLDNAGKIFPGQNTSKWSNIFRVTVVLKDAVDPDILSQAVRDTLPRFPCFDVRIRRGFSGIISRKTRSQRRP